jgi:hypothetical protein
MIGDESSRFGAGWCAWVIFILGLSSKALFSASSHPLAGTPLTSSFPPCGEVKELWFLFSHVYLEGKAGALHVSGQLLVCHELDNARENAHNYIKKI